jgi:hypothetical protein
MSRPYAFIVLFCITHMGKKTKLALLLIFALLVAIVLFLLLSRPPQNNSSLPDLDNNSFPSNQPSQDEDFIVNPNQDSNQTLNSNYGQGDKRPNPVPVSTSSCYSNADCLGSCLCQGGVVDDEGYLVGECSSVKYSDSSPAPVCTCILEEKTMNPYYPSGCE